MITEFWNAHSDKLTGIGNTILDIAIIFLLGVLVKRLLVKCVAKFMKRYPNADQSLTAILNKIVAFLTYGVVLLMMLDKCGINTASVLTVLGASALAVGIALKDTLSNIAAGFFLLCQRPYKTGDYISCAGTEGTIAEIGLFTTHMQTVQGQDIHIPNNAIMASNIINYSSNATRRADIPITISYECSLDQAVDRLLAELKDCTLVLKDPKPEVLVTKYGDNGIELDLRYWTKNEDYWTAYWRFNHILKGVLVHEGIAIPYPQVVVHFPTVETPRVDTKFVANVI